MAFQADLSESVRPRRRSLAPVAQLRLRTLYERRLKRPFDVAVASGLLVLFAPVMALIWFSLRTFLGPPVLMSQKRVGLGGHDFSMLKFRTMQGCRRLSVLPFQGSERRMNHKSDDDPRHTSVGRMLRRTSLDELPQLVNVIRGDMSLVGPRPEMSHVVDRHG